MVKETKQINIKIYKSHELKYINQAGTKTQE